MLSTLPNDYDFAIIGFGFSGLSLAYNLARTAAQEVKNITCIIFEPSKLIGAGIAYDTWSDAYILNVPADKMGIDETDHSGFQRWLESKKLDYSPDDFVPRRIYQQYLDYVFSELNQYSNQVNFTVVHDLVRDLQQGSNCYILKSNSGESFCAKNIFLALGNSLNSSLLNNQSTLMLNPWTNSSFSHVTRARSVLIAGTGLSAVDVVLALEEEGYQGQYCLVSRRGQLPHSHNVDLLDSQLNDHFAIEECPKQILESDSVVNILGIFRKTIKTGCNWYDLIDALRADTPIIWKNIGEKGRRSFIRHLRPYWDAHRHRIPPASALVLKKLAENKRLKIVKSKFGDLYQDQDKIFLKLIKKSDANLLGPFDLAFNCLGLWTDLNRVQNELLNNLKSKNLCEFDSLAMGLITDTNGQLLNQQGEIVKGIYTLGSLRRGSQWESTAVREIRLQAAKIVKSAIKNV